VTAEEREKAIGVFLLEVLVYSAYFCFAAWIVCGVAWCYGQSLPYWPTVAAAASFWLLVIAPLTPRKGER
jgi:hypothetical protein